MVFVSVESVRQRQDSKFALLHRRTGIKKREDVVAVLTLVYHQPPPRLHDEHMGLDLDHHQSRQIIIRA